MLKITVIYCLHGRLAEDVRASRSAGNVVLGNEGIRASPLTNDLKETKNAGA
jgi:hypothetical protein